MAPRPTPRCCTKRLTFGIKISPYLALQVLQHLAKNHCECNPVATHIILSTLLRSSATMVNEADAIKKELNDLLREAEDPEISTATKGPKVLRVHWDVSSDYLHIAMSRISLSEPHTKCLIASDMAKVFDVLGLFPPALVPARTLLQDFWKHPIKLDDQMSEHISAR